MKTKFFLLMMALMFCAIPMFAQGGAATGGIDGRTSHHCAIRARQQDAK